MDAGQRFLDLQPGSVIVVVISEDNFLIIAFRCIIYFFLPFVDPAKVFFETGQWHMGKFTNQQKRHFTSILDIFRVDGGFIFTVFPALPFVFFFVAQLKIFVIGGIVRYAYIQLPCIVKRTRSVFSCVPGAEIFVVYFLF